MRSGLSRLFLLATLVALLFGMINPIEARPSSDLRSASPPLDQVITGVVQAVAGKPSGGYDYTRDIVAFTHDILRANPAPYQEDILSAFIEHGRVAVRGPHGLGKTAISAWIVLWSIGAFSVDVKTPTTASAWRQLKRFTWPEIRKWAARADWDKLGLTVRLGKEMLDLSFRIGNREAFAVASDNPALIEGAHASLIVYVFDEAKAIPGGTWDAAEGAFSGAGQDTDNQAYALAISTPGEPSGRFYDIHARKPGYEDWWTRHVTLEEAMRAGRISNEWVEQRRKQWGEQSAVFQNRVLGEFADSGEDSVIPLRWVELANERWRECEGKGEGPQAFGVDVARYGVDKTAIAHLIGWVIERLDKYPQLDTMQTTGKVVSLLGGDKQTPVAVDTIGIGAGVYDRLHEQDYAAIPVNVSEKTDMVDRTGVKEFFNLRSALWWMVRDAIDPEGDILLALPPDDELTGDLTAPTYVYLSDGRIKVESKDDIRERIGRSTDSADAVALALYARIIGKLELRFA